MENRFLSCCGICASAGSLALAYQIFVFPNAFAPAGFNGIITILQYLLHINIGYLSLLVNIPMLAFAWKKLGRTFAVRTLLYICTFSLVNLWLSGKDLSRFLYHTENGTSLILGPIAAGVISGLGSGYSHLLGGSTAGMEILASYIESRKDRTAFVRMTFLMNSSVAVLSYFVYGFQIEPVLLCLVYCYVSARVSDAVFQSQKTRRTARQSLQKPFS